ncbi:MAG: hypothetical protein QOC67_614 [Pseudonocardiales bacterium]|jgi:hypothetical protein|nr:hypothetical protein [Pseudonocardiales bacterium]MDT7591548.1 hypothetical protein [Pseudonocardiales bacterium]MDT7645630.1 hypothetical protein [Pseudonocardiales bacterium]MDT7662762.1 hypothetical protein [Pseudonocardiales bacterium]MDT7678549.1 hypothetical protein [Pseudonocardiales bacterium]
MLGAIGRSDRPHPRQGRRGEARLPAVAAVLVAIALYALLPERLLAVPRYVVPALEILLLIPVIVVNPRRLTRQTRWSRRLSLAVALVIAVANQVALGLLLHALLTVTGEQARELLLAAGQVWFTNIIAFGLIFWELDRGGPVARTQGGSRRELPAADFRFSQDENDDAVEEVAVSASGRADWVPTLIDYLYVSVTNSTAFSPTDTMPLSTRAKLLMTVESVAALLTSVLVIARAVGALPS